MTTTNSHPGGARARDYTGDRRKGPDGRWIAVPASVRFWRRVQTPLATGKCWLWTGDVVAGGYGTLAVGRRSVLAHRWSYERFVGPIPDGLEIDHLCRVRHCVNPDHLEAVTSRENVHRCESPMGQNARKEACPEGHPYDVRYSDGRRGCRRCNAAKAQRYRSRKAAQ